MASAARLVPGNHLRSFFDGQVWVLANDRHHHADHQLQAANFRGFLLAFRWLAIFPRCPLPASARLFDRLKRLDVSPAACVAIIIDQTAEAK